MYFAYASRMYELVYYFSRMAYAYSLVVQYAYVLALVIVASMVEGLFFRSMMPDCDNK